MELACRAAEAGGRLFHLLPARGLRGNWRLQRAGLCFRRALVLPRTEKWGRGQGLEFTIIPEPPIVTSARKMQDHPLRNFLAFCFMLAFPVAVFSRRLSFLWYYREG